MESDKKKTSLIIEEKNSLEGLTRKGLLESQLTYKMLVAPYVFLAVTTQAMGR